MPFTMNSRGCSVTSKGRAVAMGGGKGGSAVFGTPFEAGSGKKTLSVSLVKYGMFSSATIGVVHLGEALEVDSMPDLKRSMLEMCEIFSCSSAWGWKSDGTLWCDGEREASEMGIETYSRSDKVTLLLDMDLGILRLGKNGLMLERKIEGIPAGVCFVMSGHNVGFEIIKFDDGLQDKAHLLALEKKAKHELIALDKVQRLHKDAEQAHNVNCDTPSTLHLISLALVECSNAGEAGAAKAAELETLRRHCLEETLSRCSEKVANAQRCIRDTDAANLLLSSVKHEDWYAGHSIRALQDAWKKTAQESVEAVRECAHAGPQSADLATSLILSLASSIDSKVEQHAKDMAMAAGALRQMSDDKVALERRLQRLEHQICVSKEAARGAYEAALSIDVEGERTREQERASIAELTRNQHRRTQSVRRERT
jgi:hypothetical protein